MQTAQKDISQRFGQPVSQAHIGNSTYRGNKGQRNYARGRVNHVTTAQAQDTPGVVLGTFSVNSVPATILFDSGASHYFITEQFVAKHDIPMSSMKTHLLISSPNGEMKSTYVCPRVNLKIREIDFQADLVVLTSSGIDVILGMDWLGECDGMILCAKKSVLLTSPQGERIEVVTTAPSKKEGKENQDEGKQEKKL
jgi:predicted aspartyl protease